MSIIPETPSAGLLKTESLNPEPSAPEISMTVAIAPVYDIDFPLAYLQKDARPEAGFRCEFEDFCVDETLGFELSGAGEHVYLHVYKRGDNTAWVVKQIARLAEVATMDVGYCGLKDRRALTSQWFSIYLPKGPEPDWSQLNSASIQVTKVTRHSQKLRRGQHKNNRFCIRLRDLSADLPDTLIEQVLNQGVPNYFGEQRFGHGGENLNLAEELLSGERKIRNRQRRGLILSAARSYLFNLVLASRVRDGSWNQCIDGDTCVDIGTGRFAEGPLWGRGRSPAQLDALAQEAEILEPWAKWRDAMEHMGLSQDRRALVLRSIDPSWQREGSDLILKFALSPGCYATALLRELAVLKSPEPTCVTTPMQPEGKRTVV